MIEVLSRDRCVACDACVRTCPNEVFESTGGVPAVARQEDCHTCFLCELYCHEEALYVSPLATPHGEPLSFGTLVEQGLVGSYGRAVGWELGRPRKEKA